MCLEHGYALLVKIVTFIILVSFLVYFFNSDKMYLIVNGLASTSIHLNPNHILYFKIENVIFVSCFYVNDY